MNDFFERTTLALSEVTDGRSTVVNRLSSDFVKFVFSKKGMYSSMPLNASDESQVELLKAIKSIDLHLETAPNITKINPKIIKTNLTIANLVLLAIIRPMLFCGYKTSLNLYTSSQSTAPCFAGVKALFWELKWSCRSLEMQE